jgi:hypothetical protein
LMFIKTYFGAVCPGLNFFIVVFFAAIRGFLFLFKLSPKWDLNSMFLRGMPSPLSGSFLASVLLLLPVLPFLRENEMLGIEN